MMIFPWRTRFREGLGWRLLGAFRCRLPSGVVGSELSRSVTGKIRAARVVGGSVAVLSLLAAAGPTASIRFLDVAKQAGLTDVFVCGRDDRKEYIIETLGGGVALFDYNRDGNLDAFFVTGSTLEGYPAGKEPTNHLYRNKGDGTFTRVSRDVGLAESGWGQGVCAGDFDNDGWDDLFVTYWGKNRLYRNTGKGTFSDVAPKAGLAGSERWSTGCAFVDYDRDGNLDLFVANYVLFDRAKIPKAGSSPDCRWKGHAVMCGPRGLPGESNQLFRNRGDGTFEDVSSKSGVAAVTNRYSLSVTTLDYDADGWPDIYVAVDSKASILFRNKGDGTFEDIGTIAGVAFSEDGREQAGMGTAAGDFNGDGHLDLAKTNFIEDTANLYRNNGDGSFDESITRYGLGRIMQYMGWGVGFFDFDSDTWPDILQVNGHVYPEIEKLVPNNPYHQRRLLFRNDGGQRYLDVTEQAGSGVTTPRSSRGLAFGDYDNDGDVDAFVNNMNDVPSLLRNESEQLGGFLSIQLAGKKSNRSGIGASVKVRLGKRELLQEARSGSTFMSQSDLRLHFGLGQAKSVDEIIVRWPSGAEQSVKNVDANQFITITELEGITERKRIAGRGGQ